ncbi:MAG: three-Cys-motif partner protein TcmP [Actinobacteria bacterium]|nr:three-Cys-motif partner protein TcmP [Actinomycetota bacterium]
MEKIYLKGYPFFFWKYEEQTKIKHLIFATYFDKWIKILGKRDTLNYFDCFAGCGAYIDENKNIYYGSPILAAEKIKENKEHLFRKVNMIIIEKDEENLKNLEKIFQYKKLDVNIKPLHGDFDKAINSILSNNEKEFNPSFFFIDPFGFKINFKTIEKIMKVTKSEVLINFMYNSVNRFLIDNIESTLNNLFNCEDWKKYKNTTINREKEIVKLYRDQLKQIADFVISCRVCFPTKKRTYYYLYHLTKHVLGCSVMKSCIAQHCKGRLEYLGSGGGQMTFNDIPELRINEIEKYILNKYHEIKKEYIQLIRENIDNTSFLESEIKKALKSLEKENKICIKRIESKKTGLTGKDIIIYN